MTECKYLYDFDYSCGHHTWDQLDRQLTRDEYYLRVAGKCPACRAVTTEDDAVLAAPKATRPDCDNLSKLILDGMTKARYWHDDAQVADLHIKKFTSDTPGAYVFVARIGGDK